MKKTFTLISLLSMLGSVAFGATEFKISSMQTQETSCAVTVPYTVYGGKSPERALYDALQGDKNIHFKINFEESFGRYYNPYNVLRFPSDARLGFRYRSHIKPAGENEVVVLAQGSGMKTNFAIPTAVNGVMPNRNTVAGQFVFTIVRQQQGNGKGTAQEYKYMPTTPTPWVQKSTTLTTLFNGQTYKDNECLNIYVGRCGDGIVDNGNNAIIDGHSTSNGQLAGGETCDEGSLNGTAGHCNISCSGTGIVPSTGGLILTKSLVTSKTYLSGETVEFRVDFKNNGTTQADFVILQDVLPYSVEYISSEIYGVTATSGKYTQNGSLVVEYSGFNLQPGQAGYMLIRGKVLVPACSTSKTNFAFLYANKDNKPLSAQADYTCSNAATPDPICKNITTNTTTNGKDIHVLCLGDYTNTNTPMIIDCGSSAQTQYHQSTADTLGKYSATCSYSSVSKAKESKISCKVANSTCNTTIGACTLDANAHVAIVGDEGNGKIKYTCETKDGSEQALQILCGNEDNDKSDEEVDSKITHTCTYTEEDYKKAGDDKTLQAKCIVDGDASCSVDTVIDKGVLSYCGNGIREGYEECDGGGEYGEGEWKGQMCKEGCTLCDECHDEVTQCLSIDNGNVSVQKDEILPFWWKMYKPAYIVEEKTCDNKSQAGNIKRSSMRCTFSLRQPGESKAIDILDDVDCDKQQITNQALFSNFYQSSRSKSFGTWFLKLDDVLDSSKFEDNVFGEYKLRLHKVKYDYCACDDDGDCEWKKTQINNICETNFTITRPYLIQKSAFGTSPRATDAKLSNFFDILGNPLIKKTDLEDVMILDEKAYTSKTDAKFMIVSEAAQIAKLAVTMNKAQLPAALQNTNITVKKVPNKAIYLLEAKNKSTYTINVQDDSLNKVPFTIITKNIDLVINGSMNTNGLFVTQNGTINFRQSLDLCAAPQVVKGIFVAGNGFTTSKIENSNLNQNWCQYGNLHVKGILVGAGIDNLVENRRSNLNNWFNVSGSEKSIKVQRRNQIFNGASLMIEYNPDLWKTLPPGAEQFVNLLDVYKK